MTGVVNMTIGILASTLGALTVAGGPMVDVVVTWAFAVNVVTAISAGAIAGLIGTGLALITKSDVGALAVLMVWIVGFELLILSGLGLGSTVGLPWTAIRSAIEPSPSGQSELVHLTAAVAWCAPIVVFGALLFDRRDL